MRCRSWSRRGWRTRAHTRGGCTRAGNKPKPEDIEFVEVYTPPDKSFELVYPAGWKVTPGKAPGTLVSFADESAPPDRRQGIGLVATLSRPGQELKDAAKAMKAAMPRRVQGYKAVDDEFYEIGDWKVYRLVYDATGKNGIVLRTYIFTVLKDGVLYNLVCAGPPDKAKEVEQRGEQICGGLKINARPTFETPAATEKK